MLLEPAARLDDVYQTLFTQPLINPKQFDAFYRQDVNAVRGRDQVRWLALNPRRSFGGAYCKCFLMGHSGVGKSTEMTRLAREVAGNYQMIRFSAVMDLDSAGFRPFDVLLAMMIRLAEETARPVGDGGAGKEPPKSLIEAIYGWFATERATTTRATQTGVGAAAGLKPSPVSWAALLGLFAEVKGEIKYTADRKTEITEYRLHAIASLIDLLNRLLDESNQQLRESAGREWLFVGEDFDKPGIPPDLTESLFLNYANIFSDLRTHLIFSIPIHLGYSERAAQLLLPQVCIPDTPVFDRDHKPHMAGRRALRVVLAARIVPALFAEDQMERLIIASGGNLRDLFEMVVTASDNAALRDQEKIAAEDATAAIQAKRSEYVRRLGTSPYDPQPLTYDEKVKRLLAIYHNEPGCDVPDPALHSLLRARAVQEFNGERWFGVHPLVVDTLVAHGKLKTTKGQAVPGGTG
jgi:hypothetical protein